MCMQAALQLQAHDAALSAAAGLQQKLFLTKANRRNAVVDVLVTLPLPTLNLIFSIPIREGNAAQLLGALPPHLQV